MKDRRAVWEQNLEKVKKEYPSTNNSDWMRAIQLDRDVFTDVLGDVLKTKGKRSKPGKRPVLDRAVAHEELLKLSGQSYSELPFQQSFKALTYGRSIRSIAAKTEIQKDHVHRLLKGTVKPTFEVMEKIAEAFSKDPSYFIEYRVSYVLLMMDSYLSNNPESATIWFRKLGGSQWH